MLLSGKLNYSLFYFLFTHYFTLLYPICLNFIDFSKAIILSYQSLPKLKIFKKKNSSSSLSHSSSFYIFSTGLISTLSGFLFTNLPFTRGRLSATDFRHWYTILLSNVRRFFFNKYRSTRCCLVIESPT